MDLNRNQTITAKKEALVSLVAILYIEEHGLLSREWLSDAKASLQALFLRTSGEETMLRKLIEILKTTRQVQGTFTRIAQTLEGVQKSANALDARLGSLRNYFDRISLSAEENADFGGPFLSFSQQFQRRIETLARAMRQYLESRETEAKHANIYRIAKDARTRLRERLSTGIAAETRTEVEGRIKKEVVAAFDYTDAESNYKFARRDSRNAAEDVRKELEEIHLMCQMAMNPAARDPAPASAPGTVPRYEDVYTRFVNAMHRHSRLQTLKDAILELFRLYQSAHGMFRHDFDSLNRAVDSMLDKPDTYFDAKAEDTDITAKRQKLFRIERLIPFLERGSELVRDEESDSYPRFSRVLSAQLENPRALWAEISEDLLRAKIQADADVSTRLE
ncbi:MAG: hypothetical protein A2140_00220 [Candidatus Muproteobacteria bacterium RBG_16_62_13]|uniref:Uncharacterized protein n=1 Tax=Candidatus Muproteobacteria bacterium RBG_16_62_13 TaxID=1817756 RepID=A0A1F6T8Z4_9PROT|nr:MAG: hypothetical protein A2140_00220 [Candidatus Muproteobacteria bacterium RBG_16_62_13]